MKFLALLVILLSASGSVFSQGYYDITKAPIPYSEVIKNYPITYMNKTTNTLYKSNPQSDLLKKYGDFDEALYFKKYGEKNMVVKDSLMYGQNEEIYKTALDNHANMEDPINDLLDVAQVKVMVEWLHKNNKNLKLLESFYEKEIKDINEKYDTCKKTFPQKLSDFNKSKKTDPADVILREVDIQVNRYIEQIKTGK